MICRLQLVLVSQYSQLTIEAYQIQWMTEVVTYHY